MPLSLRWAGWALALAVLGAGDAPAEPRLIGHRGAALTAPENTLPAFQQAFDQGGSGSEIDIRPTLDEILVTMHDATVDRTTDGTGSVRLMTLAELKLLDAGSWFDPIYTGTRVPTLEEAIELADGQGFLVLDRKNSAVTAADVSQIADILASTGAPSSMLLIKRATEAVLTGLPGARALYRISNPAAASPGLLAAIAAQGFDVVVLNSTTEQEDVDRVHAAGLEVYVTPVNGAGLAREFIRMGVDWMDAADPSLSAQMECSDGLDNDGDGLIDHPLDPECRFPLDLSEEPRACSDGVDNDGDGRTDHPDDPDCPDSEHVSEYPECTDGLDNDGDARIDHPLDPDCRFPLDPSEEPRVCSDGVDNDGDGRTDYPDDPDCPDSEHASEYPECADGIDNDNDRDIDYPDDRHCTSPEDISEDRRECSDGIDNDADGDVDLDDIDCTSPDDQPELPDCRDGVDNDFDTIADYPLDAGCRDENDASEVPDCQDGLDNDGNGLVDFPLDPGCVSENDPLEFPPTQVALIPSLGPVGLALAALLLAAAGLATTAARRQLRLRRKTARR